MARSPATSSATPGPTAGSCQPCPGSQAPDVGLGELLVGEVREGGPAPEPQRLAQCLGAAFGVAVPELSGPLLDEPLEPTRIDRVGARVELVPRRFGRKDLPAAAKRLECAAEVGHVDLDRVRGRARRAFAPQQVDEPIDRHDLSGVEQQDRQERSLLRRAEVRDRAVRGYLKRAEKPKVHQIRRHRRFPPLPMTGSPMRRRCLPARYRCSTPRRVGSLARRTGDSMPCVPRERSSKRSESGSVVDYSNSIDSTTSMIMSLIRGSSPT